MKTPLALSILGEGIRNIIALALLEIAEQTAYVGMCVDIQALGGDRHARWRTLASPLTTFAWQARVEQRGFRDDNEWVVATLSSSGST